MTYNDIFIQYYTLYRAEAQVPDLQDDEYVVGIALANEAIRRWASYENTKWKELFATAQLAGDGELTVAEDITTYACPADMAEPGGRIRLTYADGTYVHDLSIMDPHQAQFFTDRSNFAYFTGDPNHGFVLNLNAVPTDRVVGASMNYMYYRKPNLITDGDSVVDMSDPMFIVHRMLANRFRSSRNPYYASAARDAENVLQSMKMANMSGSWANPLKLPDHSGTVWGR